ncbi:porin [Shewanella sp. JM162201]|uniref:Porin n=1 Tax=Shewanella jiangmenensis TaxID=2837387 RepID=A0ABS5V163_9GAMM|nr:porin [Shewanella jiangmenensis]MBT1444216.1 porin [Shewanella jiangmenensis]
MKKTLISASVASVVALASFGALAEGPQFYGRIDLAVTNTDASSTVQGGTSGATVGESGTYFENNFSNVGVKGSENIAAGFDVVYQLEFQVENTSNSGDTFKPRNSYLGIKTNAGTFLVGRNDTVFKQAEGGIDLFGNTNADIDRMLAAQTRSADGLWYHSPEIADVLTFNAHYLMEDNQGGDESQYGLSVTAGDKGLKKHNYYVAGSYVAADKDKKLGYLDAYRAVAQFKFGEFKVGGLYQKTESTEGNLVDGNTYLVNVAYNLNGVNLKAEYIVDDSGTGIYYKNIAAVRGDDINVQNLILGADYRISKSTLLFGHYAMYEGDHVIAGNKVDLEDDNVFTVGIRYDF